MKKMKNKKTLAQLSAVVAVFVVGAVLAFQFVIFPAVLAATPDDSETKTVKHEAVLATETETVTEEAVPDEEIKPALPAVTNDVPDINAISENAAVQKAVEICKREFEEGKALAEALCIPTPRDEADKEWADVYEVFAVEYVKSPNHYDNDVWAIVIRDKEFHTSFVTTPNFVRDENGMRETITNSDGSIVLDIDVFNDPNFYDNYEDFTITVEETIRQYSVVQIDAFTGNYIVTVGMSTCDFNSDDHEFCLCSYYEGNLGIAEMVRGCWGVWGGLRTSECNYIPRTVDNLKSNN